MKEAPKKLLTERFRLSIISVMPILYRNEKMKDLSKLEEVVMLAIWRLGDKAYGVEIKNKVKEIAGKEYFYNTLYTTLHQLVRKGYIIKHFGEPTAKRGGKRKVFFDLTQLGMNVLEMAFKRQSLVWSGITKESFKIGKA